VDFGVNVFGLERQDVTSTAAYRAYAADPPHEAELLFQTKVLAYSLAIWEKTRQSRSPICGFL